MNLMQAVVFMGVFTIWISSIIFVTSLLSAIKLIHEGRPHGTVTFVCATSFLLTVAPIMIGIALAAVGNVINFR